MNLPSGIRKRRIYRVTLVGLVVNLFLSAGKLVAGIAGRSGAMVADAVHSVSDAATDLVVIAFARISAKPGDATHAYGHGKFETLAAILVALALAAVGGGVLVHAVRAIRDVAHGEVLPRPGVVALVAAVVSIAVKEALYRYTIRAAREVESASMAANAWHHRSDALSSLGTLAGIGCAYFLGERWRIADPIAALAVAACIFKVVFDLLRAGVDELLERSLPAATEDEIRRIAAGEAEVRSVRLLRTRRLGPAIAVELHLCVEGAMTVVRSHALSLRLERRLRERFGPDTLVVVHAEPCEPEAGHGARGMPVCGGCGWNGATAYPAGCGWRGCGTEFAWATEVRGVVRCADSGAEFGNPAKND